MKQRGRQWVDLEEVKKAASVEAALAFLGLLDGIALVGNGRRGKFSG